MGGSVVARLVVVSNRVALPTARKQAAGGLSIAVKAAMKGRTGVWFGWSGKVSENPPTQPQIIHRNKITFVVLDLSTADYQEYYSGYANRVLWPTLHYRVDLAEFTRTDFNGYVRVNQIFADNLSNIIQPEDIIWVHDYHLMPLARELRRRGHENPIGFFLHIPYPPPDILTTLPHHEESLGTLSYYDLVGFQTDNDRDNFGRYIVMLGGTEGRDGTSFTLDRRTIRVGTFPVGIETAIFARLARNAERSAFTRSVEESLGGKRLLVGADRLDYTKGLPNRMEGFAQFLLAYPEWHGRATLLQITPTSRSDIQEYADMNRAVSELVGRINGHHGEADWTPIRYVNRTYSRTELAGIYRVADIALVTPLRDGMNLVAKEYVAAQDPEDPGVLILSQFAGAAADLDAALLINPHEVEAFPGAIKHALEMSLEERRERHGLMYKKIQEVDIHRWARRFLAALAQTQKAGLLEGIRSFLSAFA
ncbi:MAG: alpha,alpha-trehalose-phosphate synthase (UDP-forming) [Methylobacteriaceae bacterium]|nr:alpha,alpha-trehalose-phosphate synthase (UDP-forming) [Methylobacteriaceae bacterium]